MPIKVDYYEVYQVGSEYITADLLVWQRYRKRSQGVFERLLDDNPQLSVAHRTSPFIPPGTVIRLPIDTSLLRSVPRPGTAGLWTDRQGYRL